MTYLLRWKRDNTVATGTNVNLQSRIDRFSVSIVNFKEGLNSMLGKEAGKYWQVAGILPTIGYICTIGVPGLQMT